MRHQACVVIVVGAVAPKKDVDPDLDVLALRLTNLTLRGRGQISQIAVLDTDQIGFVEREVEVEIDQSVESGFGVRCVGDD